MNKTNYRIALVVMALFGFTQEVFAQGLRGEMSRILSDYGTPIISGMLILSAAFGIVQNYDKIIDKDGNGTRKEGLINVVWIIGYVVVGLAVLGLIVNLVGGMRLG